MTPPHGRTPRTYLEAGARRIACMRLRSWVLVLASLAVLVRLPFFFGIANPPGPGDEDIYLDFARRLTHGEGWGNHHTFTPGYPSFVALLSLLPGRTEDAVGVTQHLMGVALVIGILFVGWSWLGRAAGILAAALAAFSPLLIWTEHAVLADFLFAVVVFAGAVALAEGVRRRPQGLRWLALTGVLFGAATWIKPSGQFLLGAVPLALVLARRDARWVLRGSVVACGTLILVISPWVVRNAIRFDSVQMSNEAGETLFNRAFEWDHLPIPDDARWGKLALRVQAAPRRDRLTFDVLDALIARGLDYDQALDAEGHLAMTAILRNPDTYARDTWSGVRRIAGYIHPAGTVGLLAERDRIAPPIPRRLTTALWAVGHALTELWWLVSLSTLAGLLVLLSPDPRARAAGAAFVAVWLAVVVGTAMTHGGKPRYGVQVAPLAWLLGSAGATIVVSALWKVSGRRTRAGDSHAVRGP